MNTARSAVPASLDRNDPAALFDAVKDEFDAIDLNQPLPTSVRGGIAIGRSNGDGIEPGPDATRLMVLADRRVITDDEAVALLLFLHRRSRVG